MRLFTAAAMRAVDARAVELGYPSLLLMEAAGRAVAEVAHGLFPKARVLVLAGKGNNGGDGLVAARWLAEFGHAVAVWAADGQKGDAARMREALHAYGIHPEPLFPLRDPAGFDLIVDALFGTGLSRPLAGAWAELVRVVNASGLPVVAVDLPSGVPFLPHIKATATVALAGLKVENLFSPGRDAGGSLWLAPIGMPEAALEAAGETPRLLTAGALAGFFPKRPANAHKGSVGRVLVAGGYATYTGAPVLAALGAYRSGAGLVFVAYPESAAVNPLVEAVRIPVPSWTPEALAPAKAEAAAVGMGGGPWGKEAAFAVLALGLPTVIDADALHPEVLVAYQSAGVPAVATPHPGEAARLIETDPQEIAADPLSAAHALVARYPGVVFVLKGGPSVVAGEGRFYVNTTGNPAMATGGMGDVLSGVIAALLAAGLSPLDAARLGVFWHGAAGDRVSRVGLLASEVANALPGAREAILAGNVGLPWRELAGSEQQGDEPAGQAVTEP